MSLNKAKPFVKWVGGKRQLIEEIHSRLPETINNYYEPFVGGGAVFFSLYNGNDKYKWANLSDINTHLLSAYTGIQQNVEQIIELLTTFDAYANSDIEKIHTLLLNNNVNYLTGKYIEELTYQKLLISKKIAKCSTNSPKMKIFQDKWLKWNNPLDKENISYYCRKQFFNKLKSADREDSFNDWSDIHKAARFIYLNKTCFNGLYRENSKGFFNTPFGDQPSPLICDDKNLYACNEALQNVSIKNQSFLDIESEIKSGDFVYFDPPYAPLSATSSFTSYTSESFGIEEQKSLRDLCIRLTNNGVNFMQSNSSASLIYDLYENFTIDEVDANRAINADGANRGSVKEVLIYNYDNLPMMPNIGLDWKQKKGF